MPRAFCPSLYLQSLEPGLVLEKVAGCMDGGLLARVNLNMMTEETVCGEKAERRGNDNDNWQGSWEGSQKGVTTPFLH